MAGTQSRASTTLGLALYVVSGSFQPILMSQIKLQGLGDPTCQLYMFFYYLGPAVVAMHLFLKKQTTRNPTNSSAITHIPKRQLVYAAMIIATIDIVAQAMNYTGSTLAGPAIFAILYSSVGIWTAIYSRLFFHRKLTWGQWIGVFLAFVGLILVVVPFSHSPRSSDPSASNTIINTTIESEDMDEFIHDSQQQYHPHSHHHRHHPLQTQEFQQESAATLGTLLIFFGSMIHAFTYILSEAIMNVDSISPTHARHRSIPSTSSAIILSSQQSSSESLNLVLQDNRNTPSHNISIVENAFIQGTTALLLNGLWQLLYTLPRFTRLIRQPMQQAHTTETQALTLLLSLSVLNAIHSLTFYYTLKHVKGGATTAAVMKGLQAVMVFVFSWILDIIHQVPSQVFSWRKCCSLVMVVTGVVLYGSLSHGKRDNREEYDDNQPVGIRKESEQLFPDQIINKDKNGNGYGAIVVQSDSI